jgi:cation transport regulator ChaB
MNPEYSHTELSRRDFLKLSAYGLLGLMVPPIQFDTRTSEDLKNVKINFEFVNHQSERDIDGIRQEIDKNDLLIIENVGWTKGELELFNDVSRGKISEEKIVEIVGDPYFRQLLLEIRKSKKPIRFIDISKESSLESERFSVLNSKNLDFSKTLSEQGMDLYVNLKKYADWQRRREDEMIKNLAVTVASVKRDYRYNNKDLKVMMICGVSHTRLMHLLGKENEVDFQYPSKPFVFSYEDEAIRRFWFSEDMVDPKKVKKPDTELIAHVILEKIMKNWFYYSNQDKFSNTAELDKWMRNVVSKFSVGNIMEIWDKRRTGLKKSDPLASLPTKEMANTIAKMMTEKGVNSKYIVAGLKQI